MNHPKLHLYNLHSNSNFNSSNSNSLQALTFSPNKLQPQTLLLLKKTIKKPRKRRRMLASLQVPQMKTTSQVTMTVMMKMPSQLKNHNLNSSSFHQLSLSLNSNKIFFHHHLSILHRCNPKHLHFHNSNNNNNKSQKVSSMMKMMKTMMMVDSNLLRNHYQQSVEA